MILWLMRMENDSRSMLGNPRSLKLVSMSCWDDGDNCELFDKEAFNEQFVYDFFKSKAYTCYFSEILSPRKSEVP